MANSTTGDAAGDGAGQFADLEAAVAREPENAFTQATTGWALLEAGNHRAALIHFREAMRLDPHSAQASEGLLTALKAGNPVYKLLLTWGFWLAGLRPWTRVATVVGIICAHRFLAGLSERYPAAAGLFAPLLWANTAFGLLCWLGDPLFNLIVRLHPEGRRALPPEKAAESNWVAGLLGAALVQAGIWIARTDYLALLGSLMTALFVLPLAAAFRIPQGRPRRLMAIYVGVLALVGLSVAALEIFRRVSGRTEPQPIYDGFYYASFGLAFLFFLGASESGWIALIFGRAAPRGKSPPDEPKL